jgi:hypothetical protein
MHPRLVDQMADAMQFVAAGVDHSHDDEWNYDDRPAPKLNINAVHGVYSIGADYEIAGEVIPGVLLSAANGDETRPWIEAYSLADLYNGSQEAKQGINWGWPGDMEAAYVVAELVGAEVWTAIPYGSSTRSCYLLFGSQHGSR